MASIREALNYLGFSGDATVLRHFFGFVRGQMPPDPIQSSATLTPRVSVRQQLWALRNLHFNLNIITLGSDLFTDADLIEIDYSIYRLRNIYSKVGIGVGRVLHFGIPDADIDPEFQAPSTIKEMEAIPLLWSAPNNGIDVFIPLVTNVASGGLVTVGLSPISGSCEDGSGRMDGAVVSLGGRSDSTAHIMAHEIGHYLGLYHHEVSYNLMYWLLLPEAVRSGVLLDTYQMQVIQRHCMIQPGYKFGS